MTSSVYGSWLRTIDVPRSYFTTWSAAAGTGAGPVDLFQPKTVFCPAITSTALARLFGVSLVVTPHGSPRPSWFGVRWNAGED